MSLLVRSTEGKRKDLISLADVLRDGIRGKRHSSSKDGKLCSDGMEERQGPSSLGLVVFVVYYPMLERQVSLWW